jgi:cob(I)alamin adenosyltransferase
MKIYTKTGDGGATSLLGGRRVSKSDPAPEAYGTVDELNAELGVLVNVLSSKAGERLIPEIRRIQRRLFAAGSRLAAATAAEADTSGAAALNNRDYEWMESSIDEMDSQLKPLQAFILPGGCSSAVQAHRARTVCRRAERRVVALAEHLVESTGCHHVKEEIRYLNRLADYLFVAARYCNHCENSVEFEWRGERR